MSAFIFLFLLEQLSSDAAVRYVVTCGVVIIAPLPAWTMLDVHFDSVKDIVIGEFSG